MEAVNFPGEIGLGLGTVILTGVAFYIVQSVFNMSQTVQNRYIDILPYTALSDDSQLIIQQDINTYPDAKPILASDNERTGIEFAYSFWVAVNETTFNGQDVLRNVFYKGYDNNPWPLMAPGVFIKGDTNTMRIVYSSFSDSYNHIDIENIPVNKWFHVVLNFQKSALEIHINGKMVNKLPFESSLPYSNYGNINVFNNVTKTVNIPNNRVVAYQGSISGKISNLLYTRYAVSYNEIQTFYSKGPSTIVKTTSSTEKPPYLSSDWYTEH
jgi:hypothetical protein